jgi:hypothetical protein
MFPAKDDTGPPLTLLFDTHDNATALAKAFCTRHGVSNCELVQVGWHKHTPRPRKPTGG